MREALVAVPGAHIHYRDSGGTGVPVIFLHSASGNRDAWEQQIGAFTASGYRVITYDRRGWGHSVDEPGNAQPWTAAGDLLAVVNRLGIDRFHLVSTALGGYVGFDFTISHPDRLRSLVVANSLGGLQDPQLVELGRRLRSKEFDALPVEIRELGPEYRAANAEGVKRWLEHEKDSRHKGSPAPSTPLTNRLTLALLETISTPVLLLTGDADLYAPPSLQNIFSAHIKRVETAVIPGVGQQRVLGGAGSVQPHRAGLFGHAIACSPCLNAGTSRNCFNLLESHPNRRRRPNRKSSKRVHDGEPDINSQTRHYLTDFIRNTQVIPLRY